MFQTGAERQPIAAHARDGEGIHTLPDGRKLGFMEFGAPEGLPMFAFHGTPGSRFMFRLSHDTACAFGIRVIAPERPGFGLSTHKKSRSLAEWASDLGDLADGLGLQRFAVAGVSGGGPYAVACAALMPDRVAALALVSPMGPICPPEGAPAIGAAQHVAFRILPGFGGVMLGIASAGRLMFLNAPDRAYKFLLSRAGPADRDILSREGVRANLIESIAEGIRGGPRGAIEDVKIFGQPWAIPFEDIRAPAFLWMGTDDRNVPFAAAKHLADLIPGCAMFVNEGGGHYWLFDRMDDVLARVKDAMQSQAV